MKRLTLISLSLLALAAVEHAHAGAFYCTGKVNDFLVYANGDVMVYSNWRNDWTTICNMKGTRNGIDTATCATWASMAQKSVSQTSLTTLVYFNDGAGTANCSNYGTYGSSPPVVYYRLISG